MIYFIMIVCILITMILLDSFYFSLRRLKIHHHYFVTDKLSDSNQLSIAFISDLHYRSMMKPKFLKRLINKVNNENPDLILFGGDLLNAFGAHNLDHKSVEFLTMCLANLNASLGKYAVMGNHDYEDTETTQLIEKIYHLSNISVLINQNITLLHHKDILQVVGLDSEVDGTLDLNKSYQGIKKDNLTIIIGHTPDTFNKIENYPGEIMLSGHSHGGQVRLPFVGSIIRNHYAKIYDYGVHHKNNKTLVVSSGIGTTRIHVRMLNDPSIDIIQYKKRNIN